MSSDERRNVTARPFRMYTQHRALLFIIVLPLIVALSAVLALAPTTDSVQDLFAMDILPVLVILLAIGPAIGAALLIQHGPLVLDPDAQTLTYRRHVIPFAELGLVRMTTTQTLATSASSDGDSWSRMVDVEVVASGDFMLHPEDWLPRRRRMRLANRLNDTLADYYWRIGQPLDPRARSGPAP